MSRWGLLWVVLIGFLVVQAAIPTLAADWPQWGGSNTRNMAADEKDLPVVFEPGKKQSDGSGIDLRTTCNVRWVARLGTENYSSPVVADGKVFIGTNDACLTDPRYRPTGGGLLLCLDEATGKPLWQLPVPKLREGRRSTDYDEMDLGICSTPTVEGNRVYVVTNRCDCSAWTPRAWPTATTARSSTNAITRSRRASGPSSPTRRRRHHLAIRHGDGCRFFRTMPPIARRWSTGITSTSRRPTAPTTASPPCRSRPA